MKRVTLIDARRAVHGYEFIHYGSAEPCRDCELAQVCIDNLELGRRYRVIGVRGYEHACKIYDKVKVVEVEEAEIPAAIEKRRAFVGSRITFQAIDCREIFCNNYIFCKPEGLKHGDRCEILEFSDLNCKKGKELVLARLMRIS